MRRRTILLPATTGLSRYARETFIVTVMLSVQSIAANQVLQQRGVTIDSNTPSTALSETEPHAPIRLLAPNGGERYKVDDTLKVHWEADTNEIFQIMVYFTPDLGSTWKLLNSESIENRTGSGVFEWVIKANIEEMSLISEQCLIRIQEYFLPYEDASDEPFAIMETNDTMLHPWAVTVKNDEQHYAIVTHTAGVSVRIQRPGLHCLVLYSITGSRLREWRGTGDRQYNVSRNVSTQPRFVHLEFNDKHIVRRFIVPK